MYLLVYDPDRGTVRKGTADASNGVHVMSGIVEPLLCSFKGIEWAVPVFLAHLLNASPDERFAQQGAQLADALLEEPDHAVLRQFIERCCHTMHRDRWLPRRLASFRLDLRRRSPHGFSTRYYVHLEAAFVALMCPHG
jgi:hypothetical protein